MKFVSAGSAAYHQITPHL